MSKMRSCATNEERAKRYRAIACVFGGLREHNLKRTQIPMRTLQRHVFLKPLARSVRQERKSTGESGRVLSRCVSSEAHNDARGREIYFPKSQCYFWRTRQLCAYGKLGFLKKVRRITTTLPKPYYSITSNCSNLVVFSAF